MSSVTWQFQGRIDMLAEIQRYAARHSIGQRDEKLYRTACSRAYYSAYAAITARMPKGVRALR